MRVAHDNGAKRVLGHVLPAYGGEQDGIKVIDILSRHPSTAKFVATKLARRFVSDDPPPALVERAALAFRDTDGDIRRVVITIITSPSCTPAALPTRPARTSTPRTTWRRARPA